MSYLFIFTILFIQIIHALAGSSSDSIPTQIHIALAGKDADGNANSMAISWHTITQTKTSTVKYGLSSGICFSCRRFHIQFYLNLFTF